MTHHPPGPERTAFLHPSGSGARLFACVIALTAWIGIALNLGVSFSRTGSVAASVWALLRFFTILTNLAVAVVFTGLASGRPGFLRPSLLGALALSMLLVGIVFKVLLEGLHVLTGAAWVADILLHRVTPILVPLFWLAAVPKGRLSIRAPFVWALYPLAYFVYAILRGEADGFYAYPFMDVAALGWERVGVNALVIGVGFLVTALFWAWLDRVMGRPSS